MRIWDKFFDRSKRQALTTLDLTPPAAPTQPEPASMEECPIIWKLPDLIRLNQLVRDRIDFEAFKRWYDSMSTPEQSALTTTLCEFAYQAGFDDAIYQEALTEAKLNASDPVVVRAESFHKSNEEPGLYNWLMQLNDDERLTVFKQFVYLFGKAEGTCYSACHGSGSCNHWWHRDLLDERVVQAILIHGEWSREAWVEYGKDPDRLR